MNERYRELAENLLEGKVGPKATVALDKNQMMMILAALAVIGFLILRR